VIVTAAPGGRKAIVGKLGSNGPGNNVEYPELNAVGTQLVRAVEQAVRTGIVVMVSAGKHGVNPETNLPGWAGNIVWSTNIVWAENVVWGENLVWGEASVGAAAADVFETACLGLACR
jgi:hypothetical protein